MTTANDLGVLGEKNAVAGARGRAAGPGAVSLDDKQKPMFVEIFNKVSAAEKEQLKGKKRSDVLLQLLRTKGLIQEETKIEQVRAYAAKLRKEGLDIKMKERHAVDLRMVMAAWQTSASPKEAFEKCLKKKVFVLEGDTAEDLAESRKDQLLRFRAAVVAIQKMIPTLKKMGTERMSKIDNDLFVKVWNESKSVSEVYKKLLKMNSISAETKKSSLKSKANSLNSAAAKEGKDHPCKKFEDRKSVV